MHRLPKIYSQNDHLKRCYGAKFQGRVKNDILAIKVNRVLERKAEWPTEGKIKAMNMIYEDIFQGRSMLEANISCKIRIPTF
jgi:hypothetical protein